MGNKNFRGAAMKGGGYSMVITLVVLAILIVVNLLASSLPTTWTRFDISASKLYSVTGNTKAVVGRLEQPVTIYWVVQAGQEDEILKNLLAKYDDLSDFVTVEKKNPDIFPGFAAQYTDESVPNNSLIVECGTRNRYISYEDIYLTEYDYYSYSYTVSGFDGEGAITSAIDYVVTEDLPQLAVLEGHGEEELPATFAEAVEKENIVVSTLSLPGVDEIGEEVDAVLIYSPQSDISDKEKEMLAEYVAGGGKLLVMAGPVADVTFTNLNALAEDYGVTFTEGIVVEGSRDHYAFGYPYMLMPELYGNDITNSLILENYSPILPLAQGMTYQSMTELYGDEYGAELEIITPFMETSEAAFSKVAGFSISTYEQEEGDVAGPFVLGLTIEASEEGRIVWFSASDFLDDMYNAYSSGANVDLAMNGLSYLLGEREALSIRSKSLNYNYLTISDSDATTLKALMIGIFPVAYLAIGICVMLVKRRKYHEAR